MFKSLRSRKVQIFLVVAVVFGCVLPVLIKTFAPARHMPKAPASPAASVPTVPATVGAPSIPPSAEEEFRKARESAREAAAGWHGIVELQRQFGGHLVRTALRVEEALKRLEPASGEAAALREQMGLLRGAIEKLGSTLAAATVAERGEASAVRAEWRALLTNQQQLIEAMTAVNNLLCGELGKVQAVLAAAPSSPRAVTPPAAALPTVVPPAVSPVAAPAKEKDERPALFWGEWVTASEKEALEARVKPILARATKKRDELRRLGRKDEIDREEYQRLIEALQEEAREELEEVEGLLPDQIERMLATHASAR